MANGSRFIVPWRRVPLRVLRWFPPANINRTILLGVDVVPKVPDIDCRTK